MSGRATVFMALGCLVLGMLVGAGGVLAGGPSSTAKPYVVEGYVDSVNHDGTAIGLSSSMEAGSAGKSYVIAGAVWRYAGQPWNHTFPTCLEPHGSGQRVRLGVMETHPSSESGGRPVVAWLECL